MARWLASMVIVIASATLAPAQAQYALFGPLLPAERSSTETSRDVSALEYRDAYCARWSDGCAICQRTTANDPPACQPVSSNPDICQRQAVQCQAVLKSIHRVCFSWTDGCNNCVQHACTLRACKRPQNYRCYALRTSEFRAGDLHGHWRLTLPDGRSCEILLYPAVTLTASCLAIGAPATRLAKVQLEGTTLHLLRTDDEPLLAFDTSNPDDLTGIAQAQGYRLVRHEPAMISPPSWEGTWELRGGNSNCTLVLSMRRLRAGAPGTMDVNVPHGVTFMSGCVSPENADMFHFWDTVRSQTRTPDTGRRTRFVEERPVRFPLWTSWRTVVTDIAFRDAAGREIVFKLQDADGNWRAEAEVEGRPLALRLRRIRN